MSAAPKKFDLAKNVTYNVVLGDVCKPSVLFVPFCFCFCFYLSQVSVEVIAVFLSCPLVKKHADLSGSFLYSQSTMKDMYSKPTNRTELSIPMKTKALRSHSIYIQTEERSGKETNRMFLNS